MDGNSMRLAAGFWAIILGAFAVTQATAADSPKRGGILTFLIPADAPPSFDGHRENSFATVHSVAPVYSVLIRANPENPASTTDFVCDRSRLMAARPTISRSARTSSFTTARRWPRRMWRRAGARSSSHPKG